MAYDVPQVTVRTLTSGEDDVATAAASALADAFSEDPMMVFLTPDPERRQRMLPVYFRAVLRQAGRRGVLRVAVGEDGAVHGASIAMPPGTYPLPVLPQLAEWRAMVAAGAGSTYRNFTTIPPIDRLRPREPYWYVMYLGVRPGQQGSGLGGRLLAPVLDDADRAGLPAYLVTMKEANLAWYARVGFDVRETTAMGRSGPAAWTLLRPPR